MEITEIIEKIDLFRDKEKLAFFVGAGVSTLSKFPSWSQLVLSMAEEIAYDSYTRDKDGKPQLSLLISFSITCH